MTRSKWALRGVFAGFPDFFKSKIIDFSGEGGITCGDPRKGNRQKKRTAALRAVSFLLSLAYESRLSTLVKTKKPLTGRFFSLRRGRDSNPRKFDLQRFSRPPQ
jgi:hypothetical protein